MDFNDIMERLRAGEDIQTIGDEFAQMLNDAETARKAEIEEERLAAEAEKKAKADREAEQALKLELATNLANAFNAYVSFAFPGFDEDIVSAETIVETMDSVASMVNWFKPAKTPSKAKVIVKPLRADQTPDDVLSDFLKKFGW